MSTKYPQSLPVLDPESAGLMRFKAIASNPYGFQTAVGALVMSGFSVRPLAYDYEDYHFIFPGCEGIKVYTPRGSVMLRAYQDVVYEEEQDADGEWREDWSYQTFVDAFVGGRIVSEDSFLKMVFGA